MTDWNQVPELFRSEQPHKLPAAQRRVFRESQRTAYEKALVDLRTHLSTANYSRIAGTVNDLAGMLHTEAHMPGKSWIPGLILETSEILYHWARQCPETETSLTMQACDNLMTAFARLFPFYRHHVRCNICLPYHQIVLLRALNILRGNTAEASWLLHTIETLEKPIHPGYFLTGTWKEFKYVPDQVRNHTINHSISITKGDLPAAADHLEFSYRNIRSYITFRQVHRLGNFLHEQTTADPEFEYGVRRMLASLVEKGHTFEMIFDLPAFLVTHRRKAFSATEMEDALDIRSSTAKKYLTICESMGMIVRNPVKSRRTMYLPNEAMILQAAADQ